MTSTFLSGFKSGMMLVLMKNPVSTRDRNSSDCVSWFGNVSNTVSKRKDISCCKCNSSKLFSLFSTLTPGPQSPNWLLYSRKGDSPYPFASALPTQATGSFGPAVATFMKGVSCATPRSVSSNRGREDHHQDLVPLPQEVRATSKPLAQSSTLCRAASRCAMIDLVVILPKHGLQTWITGLISNVWFCSVLLVYRLPKHTGLLLPFHLQKCLFSR